MATRRTPSLKNLADEYPFHPLHLEESLLGARLPQIEKEKDYVFLLLQIPGTEADGSIVSDQVAIFLGKDYLITLHNESADELRKFFTLCENDEGMRATYFKHSTGYLLYHILEGLFKDTGDLVQGILEKLDRIEGVVFDEKSTASYEIGQLRQQITKLKRIMDFLKDVLGDLATNIDDFTGDSMSRHYHSMAKTVNRLSVALDEAKETVEIFKDADFTASSARTNQVLAVLTIIFTLTIPATLLGTFYGMNVQLPGGIEAGPWTFFGPYTTFILAVIISLGLALAMGWYFWKKKWY